MHFSCYLITRQRVRAGHGLKIAERVFSNDETNRTGVVVVAVAAAVLMALTLVSMATSPLFATKAMAFVMPALAFVELDVLCKLL